MYTYQTVKFPHRSIQGNIYQMILHEIDSNSTCIEPMKNIIEGNMILAWRRALERMKVQGIVPTRQVLDNEISTEYILEIKNTTMTYQLFHPDDHRRNLEEKAFQTWKYHFIGVVSGTAEIFPTHLWCQAISQAERQLLLLLKSNMNPKISSYAHVYGPHDYNAAWSTAKLGREGNSDVEIPLHRGDDQDRREFPCPPLVPSHTASGTTVAAPPTI